MSHFLTNPLVSPLGALVSREAKSLKKTLKPPELPQAPPPPTLPTILTGTPQDSVATLQADASAKAQAAQDAQRRTLLQTGGQTNYTGPGGAPVLGSNVRVPILLGN